MGLPVDKLVVATNENDVLHRFLSTGTYSKAPAVLTIAPSMDISVSSNFERYLFYLAGSAEVLADWMTAFESTGALTVSPAQLKQAQGDFLSYGSHKDEIVKVMKEFYVSEKYLFCPHTATAVAGVRKLGLPSATTVCLATAHPAKFADAVNLALSGTSEIPAIPQELNILFSLPVKKTFLPSKLRSIQAFILEKVEKSPVKSSSGPSDSVATWWLLPVGVSLSAVAIVTLGLFLAARRK